MDEADRTRARLIRLWALSPCWSFAEGVALAYNLDPKGALQRSAGGYDWPGLRGSKEGEHLLDLAYRAYHVGQLDDDPTPVAFMKWARTKRVEFHPDWWAAVEDGDASTQEVTPQPRPASPFAELKTKEQETLLKLVGAMAMAYYGWKRDDLRSSAVAVICGDLAERGVTLHPDTVRKWLRKSADLISEEER